MPQVCRHTRPAVSGPEKLVRGLAEQTKQQSVDHLSQG